MAPLPALEGMETLTMEPHPINDGNGAAFMVHMPAGVMSIRGGTGMVV